jgi:hypothetical protein
LAKRLGNGVDSPLWQRSAGGWGSGSSHRSLDDYELIAQKLSDVSGKVSRLENRTADLLTRMADVEKVNARLEEAALITARALGEISGHWDAVYEAMRRKENG